MAQIPPLTNETILDIGCGSGVIPLTLKTKFPDVKIIGVEIQEELAELAKNNVKINSMQADISIICKDIKKISPDDFNKRIDIIISNPPYKKKGSGRLNPNQLKALARHEIKLTIKELLNSCKKLLSSKGKVFIIFPAERITDIIDNMHENNLKPETIRFIHTKKKGSAKLVIVSASKDRIAFPMIVPPQNILQI